MRVLGFSKRWHKLSNPEFTTFRFPRKDKDWQIGEQVQVVYKPRSKDRETLGIAEIIAKERRWIFTAKKPRGQKVLSSVEARLDGFRNYFDMAKWLTNTYQHQRLVDEPMNKLTLKMANTATLFSNKTKGGEHYRVDYLKMANH